MKKILWISPYVPYDEVAHAGGRIHNFYLKGLKKLNHFEIRLLTFARLDELPKVDLQNYDIDYEIVNVYIDKVRKPLDGLYRLQEKFCRWNVFDQYAGFVKKIISMGITDSVQNYKNNGYEPDVVILQWTETVLLAGTIRQVYPNAKLIAIEEDVSFQSYYRKYSLEKNWIKRCLRKALFKRLKKIEVDALRQSDLIVVNNVKDENLVRNELWDSQIFRWVPYFQSFLDVPHVGKRKDIIIYGAMSRQENYLSAIWFIENVWKKLADEELRLIIVGSNPPVCLMDYSCQNIVITGFVDDVSKYLSDSLCLVAPLTLGAGIKIKVLEGLSAGIPVLTNSIGAEGIGIIDTEHYFHCETANDYIETINGILLGKYNLNDMSKNAKAFIKKNFALDDTVDNFEQRILEMANQSEGTN